MEYTLYNDAGSDIKINRKSSRENKTREKIQLNEVEESHYKLLENEEDMEKHFKVRK